MIVDIIIATVIFPKEVRLHVNWTVRDHQRPREWDSYLPIPIDSMIAPVQSVSYSIFHYLIGSVQRCLFTGSDLDGGGLGHGDLINHETNTTLGNNIRDTVSQLDVDLDRITLNAEHGEDVHDRVGTPRNDCPPLDTLDEITDMWIRFRVGGITESNQQSVHNVHEGDHGTTPIRPSCSETIGIGDEFTRITQNDHQRRSNTQTGGLGLGFIGW